MAAAEVQYATATYGSEAYDLERVRGYALPEEEVYGGPSSQERIQERLDERARERARAKAEEKAKTQVFGIPLLGMVGTAVVVVLMVTVLMGYIRLAEISAETSKVRSSIAELEERQEILEITYETTFNMQDIESYAVNILGMTRGLDEMYTGGVILSDRGQVLAEDETAGLLARLTGFLKSLPEYFS